MSIISTDNNLCWLDQTRRFHNEDVKLYPNNKLGLVEIENQRSSTQRINDIVSASFNSLKAIGLKCYRIISVKTDFPAPILNEQNVYEYPKEVLPWNEASESKGAYFFIHGLRGFPTDWNAYVDEIKKKYPDAHVFVPWVPSRGNCSLETAGKPLLEVLNNYMEKFPGQPVTIIGTSNGGRIAAEYIESYLDPNILKKTSLSIVSISGVHYGTKVIDFLKKINLLPLVFMDKNLEEEFLFGSKAAKDFLKTWQEKQNIWKEGNHQVRHLFCATTEDEKVREIACSLPYHKDASSTYMVINGHSHTSIVDGVIEDVVSWLEQT